MSRKIRSCFVALFGAAILLVSIPLLTKEPFDPAAFEGQGCKGALQCFGMQPETTENLDRTPKDRGVGIRHRGLPSSVDLSEYLPPVGSQGRQGSCVAWSTTYYTKTLHEKVSRNWSLDAGGSVSERCVSGVARVFSPAWTYNQINGGQDRGSSIYNAMNLLVGKGAATCGRMPYDVRNYTRQPDSSAQGEAAKYTADSFTRIPCEERDALKAALAKKLPVVGGFQVTSDMYKMGSSGVWDSFTPPVKGGHAMAVIGYDDNKRSDRGHRGAFKFVNSWGTSYGKDGFGWISYDNWVSVCKYTYVLYPKQRGGGDEPTPEPGPKPEPVGTTVKAPTRVVATQGTFADRIVVSWEPGEGAGAYEVERSQGGSGFQSIGNATETNFTDSGVQAGVAFRYRVVSIGESARSSGDDSPVAEGFAQAATQTRPEVVTGFTAEAESSGSRVVVSLSWSEVAGASSYALLRHDSNSRRWTALTTGTTGTSYSDRNAPTGAVIHYAIRAQNSVGAGEYAMVEVKVGGGTRPPGVITDLKASQGTRRDGIEVSWTAAPGATGYFLLRYDPSDPEWKIRGRTDQNTVVDNDSAATSGRQVYYAVVPFSAAGAGTYTQPVMGYADTGTHRGVTPSAPADLRVSSRKGRTLTISWKASKGASEYYVFRKEQGAAKFEFVASSGRGLSYSGALPDSGTVYFYTVTAKSALGGESARAPAVAAFDNEPRPAVRRRFVPGQGMDLLAGTWKATHLGESAAYNLVLEVGQGGPGFVAKLSADGKSRGTASGKYAMDSRSLMAGGFSMDLVGEGSAVVRIDDRRLFPEKLRLVFVREKRH